MKTFYEGRNNMSATDSNALLSQAEIDKLIKQMEEAKKAQENN